MLHRNDNIEMIHTYESMAQLIASKLTKDELLQLFVLLDEDGNNSFWSSVAMELEKVKPEFFPNVASK